MKRLLLYLGGAAALVAAIYARHAIDLWLK